MKNDKLESITHKKPILIIVPDPDPSERSVWVGGGGPSSIAAEDAFTGKVFQCQKEFAKRYAKRWLILTTERGLIDPSEEISEYNCAPWNVTLNQENFERNITDELSLNLSLFAVVVILSGSWNSTVPNYHVTRCKRFFEEKIGSDKVIQPCKNIKAKKFCEEFKQVCIEALNTFFPPRIEGIYSEHQEKQLTDSPNVELDVKIINPGFERVRVRVACQTPWFHDSQEKNPIRELDPGEELIICMILGTPQTPGPYKMKIYLLDDTETVIRGQEKIISFEIDESRKTKIFKIISGIIGFSSRGTRYL